MLFIFSFMFNFEVSGIVRRFGGAIRCRFAGCNYIVLMADSLAFEVTVSAFSGSSRKNIFRGSYVLLGWHLSNLASSMIVYHAVGLQDEQCSFNI